jgi:hypothetical protein
MKATSARVPTNNGDRGVGPWQAVPAEQRGGHGANITAPFTQATRSSNTEPRAHHANADSDDSKKGDAQRIRHSDGLCDPLFSRNHRRPSNPPARRIHLMNADDEESDGSTWHGPWPDRWRLAVLRTWARLGHRLA